MASADLLKTVERVLEDVEKSYLFNPSAYSADAFTAMLGLYEELGGNIRRSHKHGYSAYSDNAYNEYNWIDPGPPLTAEQLARLNTFNKGISQ